MTRPSFGIGSFEAVLAFSKEAKKYSNEVTFSVVDVINKEQINRSKDLAM